MPKFHCIHTMIAVTCKTIKPISVDTATPTGREREEEVETERKAQTIGVQFEECHKVLFIRARHSPIWRFEEKVFVINWTIAIKFDIQQSTYTYSQQHRSCYVCHGGGKPLNQIRTATTREKKFLIKRKWIVLINQDKPHGSRVVCASSSRIRYNNSTHITRCMAGRSFHHSERYIL